MRVRILTAAILVAAMSAASTASAQNFPTHQITLVVPLAAGGVVDTIRSNTGAAEE